MSDYDPNYIPQKSYALVGQKAIVLNSQGKILVVRRSDKTSAAGKWSLPGGGLDHGEDATEGIQREIHEETQLQTSVPCPYTVWSYTTPAEEFAVIIGYQCDAMTDTVTLNWEHTDYRWESPDEALSLDLTPHARHFVTTWNNQADAR